MHPDQINPGPTVFFQNHKLGLSGTRVIIFVL